MRVLRSFIHHLALLALTLGLASCAMTPGGSGWTTLVDGDRGMDNFVRVGNANWSAGDGVIQASAGGGTPSYLVSKMS